MKSKTGWESYSGVPASTDEFGFSALPGGASDGNFYGGVGQRGVWWSASENYSYSAFIRYMDYDDEDVGHDDDEKKSYLFSVRCLQD